MSAYCKFEAPPTTVGLLDGIWLRTESKTTNNWMAVPDTLYLQEQRFLCEKSWTINDMPGWPPFVPDTSDTVGIRRMEVIQTLTRIPHTPLPNHHGLYKCRTLNPTTVVTTCEPALACTVQILYMYILNSTLQCIYVCSCCVHRSRSTVHHTFISQHLCRVQYIAHYYVQTTVVLCITVG